MKTAKVIDALENWSPKGLCDNVLVSHKGNKTFIGCVIGCMIVEFLTTPEGKKYLKEDGRSKTKYIHDKLYLNTVIDRDLKNLFCNYFDITDREADAIVYYNDHILTIAFNINGPLAPIFKRCEQLIPRNLRELLTQLRWKYEHILRQGDPLTYPIVWPARRLMVNDE